MAAQKRIKTVEFDLFPDKHTVDDDLPPDEAELKAALFGDEPPPAELKVGAKSPIGPSVTTFPRIRSEYLSDKEGAVKKSIAPYHNPENIQKEFGTLRVEELLDWNDMRNERIESMWDDPEYAFIKLVEGSALDDTLGVRVGFKEGAPVPGQGPQTRVPIQGATLVHQPEQSERPAPLFGGDEGDEDEGGDLPPEFQATEQERRERAMQSRERDRSRLNMMRSIRREAERPEVSGRMQMTAKLLSAVQKSLSDLARYNFRKFSNKVKEHFFKDETAMTLFAQLTAANVAIVKVRAPKRYYKDQDNARRLREIQRFTQQIDSDLVWDANTNGFVTATPDMQRDNVLRRRMPPSMRKRERPQW